MGREQFFECPKGMVCNWTENDWTKRLAKGIEEGFPHAKVRVQGTTSGAEQGVSQGCSLYSVLMH